MNARTGPKFLAGLAAVALLGCLEATGTSAVPQLNLELARIVPKLLAAFAAVALIGCLYAASASAVPQLGLQLNRIQAPLHLGDERLVYQAIVQNKAGANPKVDDELTCATDGWGGNPAPDLTFAWLRNGTPIAGATDPTYTVTAADAGKSIQCVVTGTNDPSDVLPGTYAPTATAASSTPVVVEPQPGSAPPSGSTVPEISGSLIASTPHGTATVTAGSNLLTDVVAAEGTGTLASGSNKVTTVTASTGVFEPFQAIGGTGIPAGTTIEGLAETAPGVFELTLSNMATASGSQALVAGALPFSKGQTISGAGISPGTEIVKASSQGLPATPSVLELSNPATASGTAVPITAVSEETCTVPSSAGITWSFQWLRNGAPIPGATAQTYTVTSADTEPPSILQCEAVAEDAEGQRAVGISGPKSTMPRPPAPYQPPGGGAATIDFDNQTAGPVTLVLNAPADPDIYIFKALGPGWSCKKTPPSPSAGAQVTCTRSDPLPPQDSYEPLEVVIALGKTPPTTLLTTAEVFGGGSGSASDDDKYEIPNPPMPFGFKAFETKVLDEFGNDYTKAGGHPFSAGASLAFNTHLRAELESAASEALNGSTRTVRTDPPRGFVGNPGAVAEPCPSIADVIAGTCPEGSAVGMISAKDPTGTLAPTKIFMIEREEGLAAQFAFKISDYVFSLEPELRAEEGYAISLLTSPVSKVPELFSAEATLCGFGVKALASEGCRAASEEGAFGVPFLTNPTRCSGGAPTTTISADTWEDPGNYVSKSFTSPPLTECDQVKFEPQIKLQPTSRQADSPTGMQVELSMPTAGLEDPDDTAQANLKSATVKLPVGMALNAAAADGLSTCTLAQIGMSPAGVPNDAPVACPESSKIGTVEATTPLLEDPSGNREVLHGTLYVAQQGANPFGSLLALYLVIDSPRNGILVKLAGQVTPDLANGQLTARFDDNPEVPIASVKLSFRGGDRAPLTTPLLCGAYGTEPLEGITSQLAPWNAADPENPSSEETVTQVSGFETDAGPGGGPCPSGGLEAGLSAGLLGSQQAGATSPFTLRLSRPDGTQRFRAVDVTMPRGLVAYLKGVPYCPEAALASVPAAAGTGAAQIAAPTCPAASQVGSVIVGAGVGPSPLFVPTGKAYLAGPYKGAPLSLAVVAPAVAGPFDLGNVVVRTALRVDPETAQITAVSDPLPTILHGLLLNVREIRINVDRPNFTVAPTNCEAMAVSAKVTGELGATATASDRFQVGGCEKLKFKPKLKLRLHGKTRRGAYQRLIATLTYPPGGGYANIASAAVTFPHSTFLAQEHIRTICTRVQFAADQCPKGSIYGKAKATSPLVDYPLQGPVYLRSSSNPLPDLVVSLKGPAHQPLEIDLVGRVDSKNGGIRNTFALVPDAPVSKFTLQMQGGRKSLLVNSRNLCKGTQRATVKMKAQNGMSRNFRPVVGNDCKKAGKKKGKGKKR